MDDLEQPVFWLPFRGAELLVRRDENGAALLSHAEWEALGWNAERSLEVGELAGRRCRAAEVIGAEPPEGMVFEGLRRLWGALPEEAWRLAGRAVQLLDWDRNHRFCGRCGAETERQAGELSRTCPRCSLAHFPRLSPAVIVRVERGDQILLARSPHFAPGVYSTLAGFVEPGESLEEAVRREIEEEVGVRVGNIRYFGSQPWPFPNSLMIAFVADYESGELRLQEGEIEDARWYTRDDLPALPAPMSIARTLVDGFLRRSG
jgi:NAD+ diphosphatase